MPDIYDREIDEIVDSDDPAEEVSQHWDHGSPLFAFASVDRYARGDCGCLTMIRRSRLSHAYGAAGVDFEAEEAIRADDRLPTSSVDLDGLMAGADSREARVAILTPFAEWQRRLDARWGRAVPESEGATDAV